MTENFNLIYNEMLDLYNDQNSSVKTVAARINAISEQIAP
jgi:flagellar hook-associated protein FlgK